MKNRVVYTPRERKKYKKQPHINKKVIFGALVVGLFMGGFVYVAHLPKLQLTTIRISGNESLPRESIEKKVNELLEGNYALIVPRRFIVFTRSDTIAPVLMQTFPVIQEVTTKKQYPDSLDIHIKERKLFAVLCNDLSTREDVAASTTAVFSDSEHTQRETTAQCVYIDNNGFAYEEAPRSSGTLITRIATDQETLKISSEIVKPAVVHALEYIIKKVPEVTGDHIVGFELPTKLVSEFRVTMSGGYKLLLKRDDDFSNAMRVLKTILQHEIKEKKNRLEYIDLRFGNKVFYKYR